MRRKLIASPATSARAPHFEHLVVIRQGQATTNHQSLKFSDDVAFVYDIWYRTAGKFGEFLGELTLLAFGRTISGGELIYQGIDY